MPRRRPFEAGGGALLEADELRRAIQEAPRNNLPKLTALLWQAFGEGKVSEAEAEVLSGLIEARTRASQDPGTVDRAADPAPLAVAGIVRRYGSTPRSLESTERRRRWAASGRLPPGLACKFTLAETAVLSLVAAETVQRGDCRLAVGHLAAVAGVSETTARNAIREARRLGLLTVEERRVSYWRNETNVLRIVSAEWTGWLRLARQQTRVSGPMGGGCKFAKGAPTGIPESSRSRPAEAVKMGSAGGVSGHPRRQDADSVNSAGPGWARAGRGRQP